MVRTLLAAAVLLLAAPALAKAPRLTLFISVDSMGADVLLRSRPNLKGGLSQAMAQGAYFPSARYEFAETVTGAGHATLATGANPWRHGVVGNRIWNRNSKQIEPIFGDADHPVLEAPPRSEDASPANLLSETLSDRLRLSTRMRGKAVAISGKARSSIAMAGRLGQGWWFNEQVGKFVTGTWYAKEFPAWVKGFNDKKSADALFGKQWALSLPPKAYLGDDDRPWESDWYAMGRTFPHAITGGLASPGPQYYAALASSPLMNDVIVQMAKAALDGEQLGKDDVPDLLSVGFSPLDRVYHLYGPYSWEMQDSMVKLDKSIGELISAAEKAAGGRANLLVVISADHGGAAIPEEWTASGVQGVRLDIAALQAGLGQELKKRFGSELIVGFEELDVYLDARQIAEKKIDFPSVRRAAAQWLAQQPNVAFAVARDDLDGPSEHAGYLESLRLGYYPERSGDVLFLPKQYAVLTDERTGTSHGTPYGYDAVVPLMLLGRGVKPGLYRQEIRVTDVAPTVAALLEISAPAMAEGTPRAEALNGK